MANTSASLDKWRDYFRTANSDIFDIIEHAIMVAAVDCPYDYKIKRDRIAEMLFTCKMTKCYGCDKIELALPNTGGVDKSDEKFRSGIEAGGSKDTKESKVNSDVDDDHHREIMEMNVNQVGTCSYGDVEALTDELEEESKFLDEVLRIKEIIDNSAEESEEVLLDSLRRLQLMPLSVDMLKATNIGKSVNALKKHRSKDIRILVRTLVENWKKMVDAWVEATAAIADAGTVTDSEKTPVLEEEEEGLPLPPLDEAAFFATPTSMELSQFFDDMDDDGNPQKSGEFTKNRVNGRKPNTERANVPKRNLEIPNGSNARPNNRMDEPKRNQEAVLKQNRPMKQDTPSSCESGFKTPKPMVQQKANNETKVQRKPDRGTIQKKPVPPQQDKLDCNDEASVGFKLEAAKRKLHERYKEAENAKKQRTTQVLNFQDLPKQSNASRFQNMRPGNQNRNWANGRR